LRVAQKIKTILQFVNNFFKDGRLQHVIHGLKDIVKTTLPFPNQINVNFDISPVIRDYIIIETAGDFDLPSGRRGRLPRTTILRKNTKSGKRTHFAVTV